MPNLCVELKLSAAGFFFTRVVDIPGSEYHKCPRSNGTSGFYDETLLLIFLSNSELPTPA